MRATEEMNVLNHVAAFMDTRQRRTEVHVHVREKTVLGIARPHRNRTGISVADFDIHIRQRRVKGAGVGVLNRTRAGPWISRTAASKEDYEFFVRGIPEAGCFFRQKQNRPFSAAANQPDAGPDIKRIIEDITS